MEDELSKLCSKPGKPSKPGENSYAPGWNRERLWRRIHEIRRYYQSNSGVIPLSERMEIARKAQELLEIFERVGGIDLDPLFSQTLGLDWLFLQTLKGLAAHSKDRRTVEGHVAAMIVRLYIEVHKKPGFTPRGPLVRFAKAIWDFLKVPKTKRLSEGALKAEFNKWKGAAKSKFESKSVELTPTIRKKLHPRSHNKGPSNLTKAVKRGDPRDVSAEITALQQQRCKAQADMLEALEAELAGCKPLDFN
jgi:hypothetical protein